MIPFLLNYFNRSVLKWFLFLFLIILLFYSPSIVIWFCNHWQLLVYLVPIPNTDDNIQYNTIDPSWDLTSLSLEIDLFLYTDGSILWFQKILM